MLVDFTPAGYSARSSLVISMTNSTTNSAAGGPAMIAGDTNPTTTSNYMVFNGSQTIRFADQSNFHVATPYSFELQFYATSRANRIVATCGESETVSKPEWTIAQTSTGLEFRTSSDGTNVTTATFTDSLSINFWNRVGIMFYTSGTTVHARGYINDTQMFDIETLLPYDSINGIAIGTDFAKTSSTAFQGRIRNVMLGLSTFWTP